MTDPSDLPQYRPVRVWGGLVRVTHWVNAIGIMLMLLLGGLLYFDDWLGLTEQREDLLVDIHAMLGFAVAASLVIRVAYMFAGDGPGSRVSGWRDVVPHTRQQMQLARATLLYYLGGFRGKPPLYLGHNPLAGFAYSGFFIIALLQVISGASIYLLGESIAQTYGGAVLAIGADSASGPVAGEWPPEWLEEMHEIGAFLISLFIGAHLLALALHDLTEARGLASSMISGDKFFTDGELQELDISPEQAEEPE